MVGERSKITEEIIGGHATRFGHFGGVIRRTIEATGSEEISTDFAPSPTVVTERVGGPGYAPIRIRTIDHLRPLEEPAAAEIPLTDQPNGNYAHIARI